MSPYLAETRYPLELAPAMPDVWELWQRAKTLPWDPETDIPWEELHPERYPEEQIMAARLHWSRRTWGEYGAISESPTLSVRFTQDRLPVELAVAERERTQSLIFCRHGTHVLNPPARVGTSSGLKP